MRSLRLAAAALVALALAGCSPTVVMDPADDANNPDCAAVIVRLPDILEGQQRRETNAQATAAWGDPSSVLLRCGVEVPAASTDRCVEIDGIFWLWDDSESPSYAFRTYGRDPAIDVVLDRDVVVPEATLRDLTSMVEFTPTNGLECEDVQPEDLPAE